MSLREQVEALPGKWVPANGYPGDHHGVQWVDVDRVLALIPEGAVLTDEYKEATDAAMNYGQGMYQERERIHGLLVDRLWGCDKDANEVLNIVEGTEGDSRGGLPGGSPIDE